MYEKEIVYDRETRDFAMYLDKELVGFARTYQEGEVTLDQVVWELLTKGRAPEQADAVPAVDSVQDTASAYATEHGILETLNASEFGANREAVALSDGEQIALFGAVIFSGERTFYWSRATRKLYVYSMFDGQPRGEALTTETLASFVNEVRRGKDAEASAVNQDRFVIEPADPDGWGVALSHFYQVRDTVTGQLVSGPDRSVSDWEIYTFWLADAIDVASDAWSGVELARKTWPADEVDHG